MCWGYLNHSAVFVRHMWLIKAAKNLKCSRLLALASCRHPATNHYLICAFIILWQKTAFKLSCKGISNLGGINRSRIITFTRQSSKCKRRRNAAILESPCKAFWTPFLTVKKRNEGMERWSMRKVPDTSNYYFIIYL